MLTGCICGVVWVWRYVIRVRSVTHRANPRRIQELRGQMRNLKPPPKLVVWVLVVWTLIAAAAVVPSTALFGIGDGDSNSNSNPPPSDVGCPIVTLGDLNKQEVIIRELETVFSTR